MLDFLVKEREAGRIRNLGWSFHGDVKVFDHVLDMGVKWDFVQIQMNYVDWNHASGRNVSAEYLYTELEKHGVPVVIMEPLLGGRLSNLPDHIVALLKQQRPENSVLLGVPFRRFSPERADRVERHDLYGAFARQRADLLAARSRD